MITNYDDTIEAINAMAKVKMAMNRHKGNIEDELNSDLVLMLAEEVRELGEAIDAPNPDLMHIIEEAADVQNFLLAVVHKQVQLYRNRKK